MPRYALKVLVAPTAEPITRAEAKAHLRVDLTDDDALIDALISTARHTLELEMGRTFLTTQWTLGLETFPWWGGWGTWAHPWGQTTRRILLPRAPLQSVASVTYVDTAGVTQTLATTVYGVDTLSEPGLVYLKRDQTWPSTDCVPNAVQITYTAGWTSAALMPPGILSAIKLLVGHLYENREPSSAPALTEIPLGVQRLIGLHRLVEAA